MFVDYSAKESRRLSKEKYDELIKFIKSVKDGKLNEWYSAYSHIKNMETELEEAKLKLAEYEKYFKMLNKLLPKNNNILG